MTGAPRVVPKTMRQQALLRYLAGYAEAHGGRAPTLAEMVPAIRVKYRAGVITVLHALERRGLIRRTRDANGRSAIDLLFVPAVPRAPDGAPLHFIPVELLGFHGGSDA